MDKENSQQTPSPEGSDKSLRSSLDFPFWITHIAVVLGWILMPSLTAVIMFSIAIIATISYIVSIGKFAKETGRNPTKWSMLTLLGVFIIGPFALWFSYIRSFDKGEEVTES